MGQLEPADLLRQRARERTALVTEPLALEQPRGRGGAVHRHERPFLTITRGVNGVRDELFACSCLPQHQDAGIGRRDRRHLAQNMFQRLAFADDLAEMQRAADLLFEIDVLAVQAILERGDLVERERVLERDRDLRGDLRHPVQLFARKWLRRQAAE